MHKYSNLIFPLLAITIPLVVRTIPEILMYPYAIGFDTVGYYLPNTLTMLNGGIHFWAFIGDAPLLYMLLMGITAIGAPIIVTLKVLGPLLLGILGLMVFLYARKNLAWSNWKSLVAVIFATLYFVALRISWDMLRLEFGLIFLFAVLILLESKQSIRNSFLLVAAMAVVVLAHQLIAVLMFVIVFVSLIRFYKDKKKATLRRLLVCSVVVAGLFLVTIYASAYGMNFSLIGSFPTQSAGEDYALLGFASYQDLVVNTSTFLLFCYLPLLPLLILGFWHFKGNIQLKAWIGWILLAVLLTLISPYASFSVYPYRWILLLSYPLAFFAAEAFSHLKQNWYRIAAGVMIGLVLATLSIGFISMDNKDSFTYYHTFPSYIPKSMLDNTVQLSDCQDTTNAVLWAKNNMPSNGTLMVHDVFHGWAALTIPINRLYPYAFYDPDVVAQKLQETNPTSPLYMIWWVNGTGWYGHPDVPAVFKEIYQSGDIAIYQYQP